MLNPIFTEDLKTIAPCLTQFRRVVRYWDTVNPVKYRIDDTDEKLVLPNFSDAVVRESCIGYDDD